MTFVHRPVLVQAVVEGLNLRPGQVVLDATLGLGGHAERILEVLGPSGRLVGVDRDPEALEAAGQRLKRFGDQVFYAHGHFGDLSRILDGAGLDRLDAALFDLGVSSLQLEKAGRGFSFAREGPLDMRMNPREGTTAADLVNRASQADLREWIRSYGEERWAGRIARAIVERRPFSTTAELAQAIRGAVPSAYRRARIDPATRTFQAIRIVVNRELELLPLGLAQSAQRLRAGGRIAVLSYHSLEDRIVKVYFREEAREGRLQVITRKPVRPSGEETAQNPRARSARLRVAQKR